MPPTEYPCRYRNCGHTFSSKDDLSRHSYILHAELRRHECEECGRTFTRKRDLERHQKRGRHGRFFKICGEGGGSKTKISVDPKNVNESVPFEGVDKKPALNDESIPSSASPKPSGLMTEAVAPLEPQQPLPMNGPHPVECTATADGRIEMKVHAISDWTPSSYDDTKPEGSECSSLNGQGDSLECKDRHATETSFDGDSRMVASISNHSTEYNLNILEFEVLSAFQTREVGPHNALLNVEWDVLAFMRDQFPDNHYPNTALDSVVTICGSVQHAQATTCAEYVKQNWAAHGLGILDALQDALNNPKHTSQARINTSSVDKRTSGDNTRSSCAELGFDVSHDKVCVNIKSEALDVIVSAISQLAWMGTALRTSKDGLVQYCEPKLVRTSSTEEGEPVTFNVTFKTSSPSERDQSCWLPLFSNPVIARGFRIPERENGEQGLEVPLEIMAALGGARHVTEFKGGLVLKGHSAMFVPIKCQQNSVQWHLICARGEDRIPYREASVQCPNRALLKDLNHEKLSTTRTFLGWWKESQTHLATADFDYKNIDWSKAKEASSSPRLTGGTVGVSKIIYAQMNFVLGTKDGSYHYSQEEPFQKTIDRAEKFPIVLYDQPDRRAWLVSALDVILHTIQLRNHTNPFVVGGKNVQSSPLDPSRQRLAAREAVAKNKSLKLFDCETNREKDYYFRDAILDTLSILDGLMEQGAETQATPGMAVHTPWQNTLYGWELMGVAKEERHLKHKAQVLEKTAGGWHELVKDIDAVVLFASGLGNIIRPKSKSAGLCWKWRSLPTGKDYLAVCVPMLETFFAKAGHRQDHQYITSAKLQWHRGSALFERCSNMTSESCTCDRIQQLYRKSSIQTFRKTVRPPGSLEENGCVVFGKTQNSFRVHKNVVTRHNAVHTLPNTSIQNATTIRCNPIEEGRLLSPPPATSISPEPRANSNHHNPSPENTPSPVGLTDHLVHDETLALKRKREASQIQLSEPHISDDEASSSEDYAIYSTKYHSAFKHDRKSGQPREAVTQTVCTPKDECDVAHVRKWIPQVSNIGRASHHHGCSCTECLVLDFDYSTRIAERRERQRV